MNLNQTIADYDSLIKRAVCIAGDAPYFQYVGEPSFARIEIDGTDAILSWPEDETSYDCTTIEKKYIKFPAVILLWDDAALSNWKSAERKKYDAEQKKKEVAEIMRREQKEKAIYLALKEKYGQG